MRGRRVGVADLVGSRPAPGARNRLTKPTSDRVRRDLGSHWERRPAGAMEHDTNACLEPVAAAA